MDGLFLTSGWHWWERVDNTVIEFHLSNTSRTRRRAWTRIMDWLNFEVIDQTLSLLLKFMTCFKIYLRCIIDIIVSQCDMYMIIHYWLKVFIFLLIKYYSVFLICHVSAAPNKSVVIPVWWVCLASICMSVWTYNYSCAVLHFCWNLSDFKF